MKPVTDPALLDQLNSGLKPVTDERVLFELNNGSKPRSAISGDRSIPAQAIRQLGLTARAGVQGITALPNMIGDALGLNSSMAVRDLLTRIGLPNPESVTERVVQDVAGAMAGQGGVMGIGRGMVNAANPVASRVGDLLVLKPGAQVVGAAGAAGGAGAARESGAGPVGITAAGLAGGLLAPVAADATLSATKAAGRGIMAAFQPFTQSGREQVVGSTLKRLATDPDGAIQNIDAAQQRVPGSQPTTAQAARDEGLLIAERGLASSNPQAGARLSRRASEQNSARSAVLNALAGDEQALNTAKQARDTSTTGMREGAFAGKSQIDIAPVEAKIAEVLASPKGKRQTVADAMAWLQGRIKGISDPEELYAIRQDVGDVLSGKLQGEKANLKLASGQLVEVRKVLDEVIESGAPGFKKYLSEYRAQSGPINQMETLQGLRSQVQNAGTDAATGERILSASKFANALRKPESRTELQKVLTPDQFSKLEAISADLDRAALSASSGKAAGSNTTQNISTAYVLGSALGSKGAENVLVRNIVGRPLGWINRLNETELQELLTDAMLDPAIARSLMAKATNKNVESLGFELLQRARAMGIGAAVGTNVPQPRTQEEAGRR